MRGSWVRERRKRLGLKQAELAEMAGVDQSTISKGENNPDWNPDHATRLALERILGALPDGDMVRTEGADSFDAFLQTEQARDLQLTAEEIETARRVVWYGPNEQPSTQAWVDFLRARRGLRRG